MVDQDLVVVVDVDRDGSFRRVEAWPQLVTEGVGDVVYLAHQVQVRRRVERTGLLGRGSGL